MFRKLSLLATASILLLSGCVDGDDFGGSGGTGGFGGTGGSSGGGFGGSGGSNQTGLALARDVCIRDIEARGGTVVRLESAREIRNRAEIVVQTRRNPTTVSTERRLCTFYYNTGLHDTRPI